MLKKLIFSATSSPMNLDSHSMADDSRRGGQAGGGSWTARLFLGLALFLIIFGIRLTLVNLYASPVPFWDQWPAEGQTLYPGWLEGTLDWSVWFERHNEHRIFFARLLFIGLLEGHQLWDPVLQMVVTAGLHGAFAVVLFFFLCRATSGMDGVCFAFVALFAGFPFDHENILSGFQGPFATLVMAALAVLWLQGTAKAGSAQWWWGWVPLLLGLGTMATGFFAAIASAGVLVVMAWCVPEARHRRQWMAIGGLMAFSFLALALHLPSGTGEGGSRNWAEIPAGFLRFLSWPVATGWGCLWVHLPGLAGVILLLLRRLPFSPQVGMTLGLTIWVILQAAAVALNRSEMVVTSRYLSINACGIAASFLWAVHLIQYAGFAKVRRHLVFGLAGWIVALALATALDFRRDRLPAMLYMVDQRKDHVSALQEYLETGAEEKLVRSKTNPLPPLDNHESLKKILNSPTLRRVLPTPLQRLGPPVVKEASPVFIPNGGLPPDAEESPLAQFWGTHDAETGEQAVGKMVLEFNDERASEWVEVWLAGAPSPKGSSLVFQDHKGGRKVRVIPDRRPGLKWQRHLIKVPYTPFTLVAADRFDDRWFAFTTPRPVGRWESQKSFVVANAWNFSAAGVLILMVVVTVQGFARPSSVPKNQV